LNERAQLQEVWQWVTAPRVTRLLAMIVGFQFKNESERVSELNYGH
jgi:hypothetical protein